MQQLMRRCIIIITHYKYILKLDKAAINIIKLHKGNNLFSITILNA